jgi:hypothetical protein
VLAYPSGLEYCLGALESRSCERRIMSYGLRPNDFFVGVGARPTLRVLPFCMAPFSRLPAATFLDPLAVIPPFAVEV